MNVPDCAGAVRQTIRIPMIIVILMKIVTAKPITTGFGADKRQCFLTKSNKIMLENQ